MSLSVPIYVTVSGEVLEGTDWVEWFHLWPLEGSRAQSPREEPGWKGDDGDGGGGHTDRHVGCGADGVQRGGVGEEK